MGSIYNAPNENLPIYNWINYNYDITGLSQNQADLRYLKLTGGTLSGSLNATSSVFLNDGAAATPSMSFILDSNTGIFRIGNDNLAISCGGTKQLDISTTLIQPTNPIRFSTTGNTIIQNSNGLSGMYFTATPGIGFTTNNASRLEMSSNGSNFFNQIQGKNGAVNDPSYSWFNEQGSGMYRAGTNDFRFSVNSTDKWRWTSSTNHSLQQLDMNSNNIINCPKVNSSGNLILETNATTGELQLVGGTLLSGTAGGSSGQHLRLKIGTTYYKIALLND